MPELLPCFGADRTPAALHGTAERARRFGEQPERVAEQILLDGGSSGNRGFRPADQTQPRWTSLPFKNRGENLIVEFGETRKFAGAAVFWYENPGGGKVKLPRD